MDCAPDLTERPSLSGFILYQKGGPVLCTSRLQSSTAQSTAEAEFAALVGWVRGLSWICMILQSIDVDRNNSTKVYQENVGTSSWTEDVQGLRKVKHVGNKYNYVRDIVEYRTSAVEYVESANRLADTLTKALVGHSYDQHRKCLGMTIPVDPGVQWMQ